MLQRCQRVANALEVGIVWINCSQPTFVQAPWGGVKVRLLPCYPTDFKCLATLAQT